jgi:hypothetical protein
MKSPAGTPVPLTGRLMSVDPKTACAEVRTAPDAVASSTCRADVNEASGFNETTWQSAATAGAAQATVGLLSVAVVAVTGALIVVPCGIRVPVMTRPTSEAVKCAVADVTTEAENVASATLRAAEFSTVSVAPTVATTPETLSVAVVPETEMMKARGGMPGPLMGWFRSAVALKCPAVAVTVLVVAEVSATVRPAPGCQTASDVSSTFQNVLAVDVAVVNVHATRIALWPPGSFGNCEIPAPAVVHVLTGAAPAVSAKIGTELAVATATAQRIRPNFGRRIRCPPACE